MAFTYLFVPKVERVTKTMSEDKKEYDLKMQEYAQLLDIRADRIRVSIATVETPLNGHLSSGQLPKSRNNFRKE